MAWAIEVGNFVAERAGQNAVRAIFRAATRREAFHGLEVTGFVDLSAQYLPTATPRMHFGLDNGYRKLVVGRWHILYHLGPKGRKAA